MPRTDTPIPGLYRHHNGGLYIVLHVAIDVTNERVFSDSAVVVYASCANGAILVRDRDEFMEWIASSDNPTMRLRFELVRA